MSSKYNKSFISDFLKQESASGILLMFSATILCGVGFTMSLFIGSLAFEESAMIKLFDERLGIIVGSLASGILGYIILKISLNKN